MDADQTDDAEMHAVAFAIRELKGKLEQFTILCDHEGVVTEIIRDEFRQGKSRPILPEILQERKENPSIMVKLGNNPAHRLLNRYLSEKRTL